MFGGEVDGMDWSIEVFLGVVDEETFRFINDVEFTHSGHEAFIFDLVARI